MKNILIYSYSFLILLGCNNVSPNSTNEFPPEHFLSIGLKENNNCKYQNAIINFSKAIELNPLSSDAFYNRGISYSKLNNHSEAVNDFTKSIELNSNFDKAYLERTKSINKLFSFYCSDLEKACVLGNREACSNYRNLNCKKYPNDISNWLNIFQIDSILLDSSFDDHWDMMFKTKKIYYKNGMIIDQNNFGKYCIYNAPFSKISEIKIFMKSIFRFDNFNEVAYTRNYCGNIFKKSRTICWFSDEAGPCEEIQINEFLPDHLKIN